MKNTLITIAFALMSSLAYAEDAKPSPISLNDAKLQEVRTASLKAAERMRLSYEDYEATDAELKSFDRELWAMVKRDGQYFEGQWHVGDPEAFKLKAVVLMTRRLNALHDMVSQRFITSRDHYCEKTVETTDFAGEEFTTTTFAPKADAPADRTSVLCQDVPALASYF